MGRPAHGTGAVALLALAALVASGGCKRGNPQARPDASTAQAPDPDMRCVERPEGCIWCQGRGEPPALIDEEEGRPWVCNPKDDEDCVEFCSRLQPPCALSWNRATCLSPTEEEFRRALYWRDTDDRPMGTLVGRVVDAEGHRIEGAQVRVFHDGTALASVASGKDGGFRLGLRAGAGKYVVRIAQPGLASEIAEVTVTATPATPERPDKMAPPRIFRLAPESQIRGKVVDATGAPVEGVAIHALRSLEDVWESGETRSGADGSFVLGGLEENKRYLLRASLFGWETTTLKTPLSAPGRATIKMARTGVIRGQVVDGDGDAEPNATVVAVLSAPAGSSVPAPILRWTADADGKFAEDRFALGTHYLWARRGDTLVYPPAKIELLAEAPAQSIELKLDHRGARVKGRVTGREGFKLDPETRVILKPRSPLAFPRDAIGEVDADGTFSVSGLLPGRHEIAVRMGGRSLAIVRGPREVEIPIEGGAKVDLDEPLIVRPQAVE